MRNLPVLGRNGPRPSLRRVNAPSARWPGSVRCGGLLPLRSRKAECRSAPTVAPAAGSALVCDADHDRMHSFSKSTRDGSSGETEFVSLGARRRVLRARVRTPSAARPLCGAITVSIAALSRSARCVRPVPLPAPRACLRARRRIPWIRVPPQVKCSRSARSPSWVRRHPRRSGTRRGLRTQGPPGHSEAGARYRYLCQLVSRDMGNCGLYIHSLACPGPQSRT